jgi:hypothetical protein
MDMTGTDSSGTVAVPSQRVVVDSQNFAMTVLRVVKRRTCIRIVAPWFEETTLGSTVDWACKNTGNNRNAAIGAQVLFPRRPGDVQF